MIFLIFLILLGFDISCMDSQPNKQTNVTEQNWTSARSLGATTNEAVQVMIGLDQLKKTSPLNINRLAHKMPPSTWIKVQKQLMNNIFTPEQWNMLDASNVTEQIIAFKNQASDNCFQNQEYKSCSCTSAIHQPKQTDLKQYITYTTPPNLSRLPLSQQETEYRAELVPSKIERKKNNIYAIKKSPDGAQVTVGPLIASLESDLTTKDNVVLAIASNIDSQTKANKIVGIRLQGWDNKDKGFANHTIPTDHKHFVATSTEPIPTLLDVNEIMQNLNRDTLLKNKFDVSELIQHQIKSPKDIEKLIKAQKKKSFCSMQ